MNQNNEIIEVPKVWETILDQIRHMKINGFPLLAYLGGKQFVGHGDDREGGLILKFAKSYTVVIDLDAGQDLYNVRISKGKFPKDKILSVSKGIFVDQLADVIHRGLGSP